MKPANFAPVYAALYPQLAEVTRSHGYALAIHGSMARDFDLVCVPWADEVSSPDEVVKAITTTFAIRRSGDQWTAKNHGRIACTINIEFGQCAIDLSFFPAALDTRVRAEAGKVGALVDEWRQQAESDSAGGFYDGVTEAEARSARVDTLNACADALEHALTPNAEAGR